MENEIHLTGTTDLSYYISFKPLQQFDIWNMWTDRQTGNLSIIQSLWALPAKKTYKR